MITVVIPVSPIPSHPDTSILDKTIDSVRYHLPDSEIILTFDGVRLEQQSRRADYSEFTRLMLWRADKFYKNICPFVFTEHLHQVGMIRQVINEIKTPLLMYVEQDTPICVDRSIDWKLISSFITEGHSSLVRLHHEASIPVEHLHMMHGMDGQFMRTSQWSQRPHVASVDLYKNLLTENFSPGAKSFIEDKMHGVASEAYILEGMRGWERHRMHIYHPAGDIKRSYHTDGRAGEPKFESYQIF